MDKKKVIKIISASLAPVNTLRFVPIILFVKGGDIDYNIVN